MDTQTPVLVAAALVPTVVALAWLNRGGRPWWAIMLVLALGAISSVPAVYLERALTADPWSIDSVGKLFLFAVIVAGVVEEGCKFALVALGPARWGWIREEYDGVLFAAVLSLGFASVENALYVLQGGLQTATVRAFSAVPAHLACGIIMGAYFGLAAARRRVRWSGQDLPFVGLGWAIVFHGVYDLLAFQPNSPITPWLMVALLGGAATWCFRRVVLARCRSPFYGGVDTGLPPPLGLAQMRVPLVPVRRKPEVSGLLGLFFGLGQAYNGERTKALVFLAISALNLSLFGLARYFEDQPVEAARWLTSMGLFLTVKPQDLVAAFEQKTLLPTAMLALTALWMLVGAIEAWTTARRRWSTRKEHAMRRSFAPLGFGSAYLLHLALALLLVLAPVLVSASSSGSAEAKQGGKQGAAGSKEEGAGGKGRPGGASGGEKEGQKWDLTWVGAPVRVQGWNPGSEGKGDGKGKPEPEVRTKPTATPAATKPAATAEARPTTKPAEKPAPARVGRPGGGGGGTIRIPTSPRGTGEVVVREAPTATRTPTPMKRPGPWGTQDGDLGHPRTSRSPAPAVSVPNRHGDPGRRTPGIPKSYNDYLAYKVREGGISEYYFRNVPPSMWSIVRYRIVQDGTLVDARVVKSNGPVSDARRIVTVLQSVSPFLPLPEGARAIEVTELFWSGGSAQFEPGTMEEQLSRLPDGREIKVE